MIFEKNFEKNIKTGFTKAAVWSIILGRKKYSRGGITAFIYPVFCETDLKYRSKERNNNNGRDQV